MRTYHHYERRPLGGGSFFGSIVGRLIIINFIVFFLQHILPEQFTLFFALNPSEVVDKFQVWQIFTYMFLHGGPFHLLFNMFILWMFGSTLESIWGSKRFFNYYIACGIGGALFSFVFNYHNYIIGASGAIFGLYLAYAMIFPENYIYINFLFPVKAKHLLIFLTVLQLTLGISGSSGIAYFAHLGGMAVGLLFFRKQIAGSRWFAGVNRKWRQYSKRRMNTQKRQESVKIDSILDKIYAKGYENLSATEKRILENYSKKRKDDESDEV